MSPAPTSRFDQPFTLQEATAFEPGTITAEIARLQNSLQHLEETQTILKEHTATDPDPELIEALRDNNVVMCVRLFRVSRASQTERVSILRKALEMKGVVSASNPHYDLAPQATPSPSTAIPASAGTVPSAQTNSSHNDSIDEDGGVFL
ncbi:hypothetical protein DL93DRAFT_2135698 [Clavulina sp. PMI_390]|nr:hypothetical protein DL93DRAFT_2135698 [Clavulina sp. PMI_390]